MSVPPLAETTPQKTLKSELFRIIFEHDTPGGKAFDVALLIGILASVLAVVLESVDAIRSRYGTWLRGFEWAFTILFTIEFVLRLYCAKSRRSYLGSFFGFVDLVAILPSYVSFFWPGAQSLLVVRVLRLLRVFRVLKLVRLHGQADVLLGAIGRAAPKITVFLGAVLTVIVVMGAAMYLVEGPKRGFENIPAGMYWAVVTITTVGFGDITPQTPLGRFLASLLMVLGYAIIAVPTGIVSSEILRGDLPSRRPPCSRCGAGDHTVDARYCRACGDRLDPTPDA